MNIPLESIRTAEAKEIAALKEKLRVLEQENKTLREREFALLKALPEIVFFVDLNERFIFLNDFCRKQFEIEPDKIPYNINIKDLLSPSSVFSVRRTILKNIEESQFHIDELKGIKNSKEQFPFTVYFSKLVEDEALIGFIGVGFDITKIKHIETQLTEANKAKTKFLSIIAHDLRNPFNALLGFSNLLLTNYPKYSQEKVLDFIKHISNAANQGYQLLENLLEWTRANAGKIEIVPEPFDISKIIVETSHIFEELANKKEIRILHNYSSPVKVTADKNMVSTIIRNLLSNAIKFTYRKGKVVIRVVQDAEYAIIEVKDNGVGIPPENLKNLFDISIETSSLGTEREKGTGLGLNLCQEFAILNKGKIEAESIVGQGSTFRLYLPLFH